MSTLVAAPRQRFSWLQPQQHNHSRKSGDFEEARKDSADILRRSHESGREGVDPGLKNKRDSTVVSNKNNSSDHHKSDNANSRPWPRLLVSKKKRNDQNGFSSGGDWMPSVSGFIKAGDEGIYGSAIFNTLHQHASSSSPDISLDELYQLLATQLRNRPLLERSSYPSEISKFLASSKKLRRSKSMRAPAKNRSIAFPPSTISAPRTSLDLSEVRTSLSRSLSRKASPTSAPAVGDATASSGSASTAPKHALWAHDVQQKVHANEVGGIRVSSSELAALSILLGSPVPSASTSTPDLLPPPSKTTSKGAYGISISSTPLSDGTHRIKLHRHRLSIPQRPASASTTSTLYAKHMACSCLPLSPSPASPASASSPPNPQPTLLVTPLTLKALYAKSQTLSSPPESHPSKSRLTSLPSSRTPTFPTYTLSTLLHSIAILPFTSPTTHTANLPPFAAAPLVDAISFLASGGRAPGRLLQRLEALVDRVCLHYSSTDDEAAGFGPMYEKRNVGVAFRERERLGRESGVDVVSKKAQRRREKKGDAQGQAEEEVANKTARSTRHVVLLERLVGMLESRGGGGGGAGGRSSVKDRIADLAARDMQRLYTTTTTTTTTSPPPPPSSSSSSSAALPPSPPPTPPSSTTSRYATPVSSITTTTTTPTPQSTKQPVDKQHVLADDVTALLRAPFPFSEAQVALVARCVLVAWAGSVARVGGVGSLDGGGE